MMSNNRGGVYMKVMIWVELFIVLSFVIVNLIIFYRTGAEPATLIMSFFGFIATDFAAKAYIKRAEKNAGKESKNEQNSDNKEF